MRRVSKVSKRVLERCHHLLLGCTFTLNFLREPLLIRRDALSLLFGSFFELFFLILASEGAAG